MITIQLPLFPEYKSKRQYKWLSIEDELAAQEEEGV